MMLHLTFGEYDFTSQDSNWQLLGPDRAVIAQEDGTESPSAEPSLAAVQTLIGHTVTMVFQPRFDNLIITLDGGYQLEFTTNAEDEPEECWELIMPTQQSLVAKPTHILLIKSDIPIVEAAAAPLAIRKIPLG